MSRFLAWLLELLLSCLGSVTSAFSWICARLCMLLVNFGFWFVERCLPACVRHDVVRPQNTQEGLRVFSSSDISAAARAALAESLQHPSENRRIVFQNIDSQPRRSSKTVSRCNVSPLALRRANETWRSMELPDDSQRRSKISFNDSDEIREYPVENDQRSTTSETETPGEAREVSPGPSRQSQVQFSAAGSSGMSETNREIDPTPSSSRMAEPSTPQLSHLPSSSQIDITPREYALRSPESQYLSQRHRLSDCSVSVISTPRQRPPHSPRTDTPSAGETTPRVPRGRNLESREANPTSPRRILLESSGAQTPNRRLEFGEESNPASSGSERPSFSVTGSPRPSQIIPEQGAARRMQSSYPGSKDSPRKEN